MIRLILHCLIKRHILTIIEIEDKWIRCYWCETCHPETKGKMFQEEDKV
jgi:hypothetical protein